MLLGNGGDVPRLEWSNQSLDDVFSKSWNGNTLSLPTVTHWQRQTHPLDWEEVDERCRQAVKKFKGIQRQTSGCLPVDGSIHLQDPRDTEQTSALWLENVLKRKTPLGMDQF